MEKFASSVAKPFLDGIITTAFELIKETTSGLIKDYTSELIKDTYSSISGVNKEVHNLSKKLTDIKDVLVDAENKQVNNPQLKKWLEKVKETAFDAEDELETFAAEASLWKKRHSAVRNPLPSLGKAYAKYDTALKIKDISKRFYIIHEEKNKFDLAHIKDNDVRLETPTYTGFLVDKSDVVGREADKEKITHAIE